MLSKYFLKKFDNQLEVGDWYTSDVPDEDGDYAVFRVEEIYPHRMYVARQDTLEKVKKDKTKADKKREKEAKLRATLNDSLGPWSNSAMILKLFGLKPL